MEVVVFLIGTFVGAGSAVVFFAPADTSELWTRVFLRTETDAARLSARPVSSDSSNEPDSNKMPHCRIKYVPFSLISYTSPISLSS